MALWLGKKSRESRKICRIFLGSGIDGEEDGGGGVVFTDKLNAACFSSLSDERGLHTIAARIRYDFGC